MWARRRRARRRSSERVCGDVLLLHSVRGLRAFERPAAERLQAAGHAVRDARPLRGRGAATVEAGFALEERGRREPLVARAAAGGRPRCRPRRCSAASPMGAALASDALGAPARTAGVLLLHGIGAADRPARPGRRCRRTSPSPTRSRRRRGSACRATARARRLRAEALRYPGAGHLFTDPALDEHDPAAAAAALGPRRRASSPTSDGRGSPAATNERSAPMTPKDASAYAREICGLAPVIPVLVVHDVATRCRWPRRWSRAGCRCWR